MTYEANVYPRTLVGNDISEAPDVSITPLGTCFTAIDGKTYHLVVVAGVRQWVIVTGNPTAHAPTHAAGGSDLLAVDTGHAAISVLVEGHTHTVSDPGHDHPITDAGHDHGVNDPGHSHSVAGLKMMVWETYTNIHQNGRTVISIQEDQASVFPDATEQTGHLRTFSVKYQAGWSGGDVTITGIDRYGNLQSETLPISDPVGKKVFARLDSITNSHQEVGAKKADIITGDVLGVANVPVVKFVRASVNGVYSAISSFDLTEGTFATSKDWQGNPVEILYEYDFAGSNTSNSTTGVTIQSHATGVQVDPHVTGITNQDTVVGVTATDTGHTHTLSAP